MWRLPQSIKFGWVYIGMSQSIEETTTIFLKKLYLVISALGLLHPMGKKPQYFLLISFWESASV